MGHGGRARLAETCGTRDATSVPARIWAAGSKGKESEQTATDPQTNGAHRDVVARRQRTRCATRERTRSISFLVGVTQTDPPERRDWMRQC